MSDILGLLGHLGTGYILLVKFICCTIVLLRSISYTPITYTYLFPHDFVLPLLLCPYHLASAHLSYHDLASSLDLPISIPYSLYLRMSHLSSINPSPLLMQHPLGITSPLLVLHPTSAPHITVATSPAPSCSMHLGIKNICHNVLVDSKLTCHLNSHHWSLKHTTHDHDMSSK